jgi:nitrite reductase (NADH) large subunit
MEHVIIGNGVAGVSAAQAIRDADGAAGITVVTEEDLPFYSRIRLPEFISGAIDEQKLVIHKEAWYDEYRIGLMRNRTVSSIDPAQKEISLGNDTRLPYDRLLIATGGRAMALPLPGIEKEGVFTLRNIQDARRIRAYAQDSPSAIIIGGGVLGLEIANALTKLGKEVTVIEVFDRLLPRQMDVEGASVLKTRLEASGMRFIMGVRTEEVLGGSLAEGVRLCKGVAVTGRLIIVSAGMKPEISLFSRLPACEGKGIPVNDRMETALSGIYAAGDAAEHRQRIYGIWPAAERQGQVAGMNMAGRSETYEGTTMSHFLSVAGIDLFSAGEIDAEGRLPSFAYENRLGGIYRKLVVKDNKVAGAILCGDTTGRKEVIKAIHEGQPVSELTATIESLGMKPADVRSADI